MPLQDVGHKIKRLYRKGRMSGTSAKVPSAIHVTPEALCGELIGKIRTWEVILIDAKNGTLNIRPHPLLSAITIKKNKKIAGTGRELFPTLRKSVTSSEEGASFIL